MKQTNEAKGAAILRRAALHVGANEAGLLLVTKASELSPAKPKKEAKPKTLRPQCPETKKDGSQCTARCAEGKATCVDHQPSWDRLTHEEHQQFGAWLRKAKGPEIVEVIGWFRAKQIAKDQAATVSEAEQERTREGSDNPAAIQERMDAVSGKKTRKSA